MSKSEVSNTCLQTNFRSQWLRCLTGHRMQADNWYWSPSFSYIRCVVKHLSHWPEKFVSIASYRKSQMKLKMKLSVFLLFSWVDGIQCNWSNNCVFGHYVPYWLGPVRFANLLEFLLLPERVWFRRIDSSLLHSSWSLGFTCLVHEDTVVNQEHYLFTSQM